MTGIFGAVFSVKSSERSWSFLFGFERVGGSNEGSPFGDGVRGD